MSTLALNWPFQRDEAFFISTGFSVWLLLSSAGAWRDKGAGGSRGPAATPDPISATAAARGPPPPVRCAHSPANRRFVLQSGGEICLRSQTRRLGRAHPPLRGRQQPPRMTPATAAAPHHVPARGTLPPASEEEPQRDAGARPLQAEAPDRKARQPPSLPRGQSGTAPGEAAQPHAAPLAARHNPPPHAAPATAAQAPPLGSGGGPCPSPRPASPRPGGGSGCPGRRRPRLRAGPRDTAELARRGGRCRAAGAAAAAGRSTRMKDMDNIKTVKKEWMCKSGTDDQILNGTEQNCDYFVDNLFEEAQKVGAICMPPTTVKNQVDVIIKLWKNGFTVNDGELRSYSDAANQQFLDSIKKGDLPFELRKAFDKEEIDVKVEDKKDKVYLLSKKPMFQPFSGHGYRLGSATPRIISKVRDDHEGPDNKRHLPLVPLNDTEPITNVQIWLADGERIIQKFNVSHRISHVRDFITKYQGSEGGVPFTLTTSLPFRELQDETLTLGEAKLQNAVVVQRLQKTTEPFRLLVIKAPDNDYKTAATPNGQLKNEQKNAIKSTRSN